MSRPRKTKVEKRSEKVVIHLTTGEKKRLDVAASSEGLPVATAARLFMLRTIGQGS